MPPAAYRHFILYELAAGRGDAPHLGRPVPGRDLGARPDTLAASGRQMASWLTAQMPGPATMQFADHSGLGDSTRISSNDLARALAIGGAIDDYDWSASPSLANLRTANEKSGKDRSTE